MSLVIANEPSSLAEVDAQMRSVEQMAEQSESIPEILDWTNKLAAIKTYLQRTSKDGRARVEAANRRLEVRIGVLLGPACPNGKDSGSIAIDPESGLSKDQRNAFRKMADHPDIVETTITKADDNKPPSRKAVLEAINKRTSERHQQVTDMIDEGLAPQEIADQLGITYSGVHAYLKRHDLESKNSPQSHESMTQRVQRYEKLSAQGHTVEQIAAKFGLKRGGLMSWINARGLEPPAAEASVRNTRRIDPDRIVNETVLGLEGTVMALKLAGPPATAGLDPDLIEGWVTSLNASMTALTRFHKQLKEMTQ